MLRPYVEGRDWDQGVEARLVREAARYSREILPDFPFLIDMEWEEVPGRTQDGRGDLLFTDGRGNFAVVEVKTILGSGSGTARRNAVERQAMRYAQALERLFPEARVEAWVYTDDGMCPGLRDPGHRVRGRLPAATIIRVWSDEVTVLAEE